MEASVHLLEKTMPKLHAISPTWIALLKGCIVLVLESARILRTFEAGNATFNHIISTKLDGVCKLLNDWLNKYAGRSFGQPYQTYYNKHDVITEIKVCVCMYLC